MSLSRDLLLFGVLLMLWAVRIEVRGYGSSGTAVFLALAAGTAGLLWSVVSTAIGTGSGDDG
jgi:hypothetical protein